MSDVTAEEIENERELAHTEVISIREANACIASLTGLAIQYKHTAYCTRVATALATVRKEARREGMSAAATAADVEMANEGVDGSSARYVLAAIRALMGPGT